MLILLSPAKTFDLPGPAGRQRVSQPRHLDDSEQLAAIMRRKSVAELSSLLRVSDEIAALGAQQWADFELPFTWANARPAIFSFKGEAYRGLDASRLDPRDLLEARKSLRILSGLYGTLRPLDLIKPYRLEMGTALPTTRGRNLYEFWGGRITAILSQDLAESPGDRVLVNLASQEYFRAVDPAALGARIIAPRFEDTTARGRRSVVTVYAKHARGDMAAWLIQTRARKAAAVLDYSGGGYRFDPAASTPERPVFVRRFEDRP